MDSTPNAAGTRRRLLKAASELFARKGYARTSIAEITRLAGANKASVNYHFGCKENLYQQTWRHAHDELSKRFPPDGGVADDAPAAQRLRGRIRAALQRALLGDAIEFRIMRSEMANPTGLLKQIIHDTIEPIRRTTQAIVRELLGPRATDRHVELCEVCVVGPWMYVRHHRSVERHRGLGPVFTDQMLATMVDHFTEFALAGIRRTRERLEAADGGKEPASIPCEREG